MHGLRQVCAGGPRKMSQGSAVHKGRHQADPGEGCVAVRLSPLVHFTSLNLTPLSQGKWHSRCLKGAASTAFFTFVY